MENVEELNKKYKIFNLDNFEIKEFEDNLNKLNLELYLNDNNFPCLRDKVTKKSEVNIDGFYFKFSFQMHKKGFILNHVYIIETKITNTPELSFYLRVIEQIKECLAHINIILYRVYERTCNE